MLRTLSILVLTLLTAASAPAEVKEADYTSLYFGTTLVVMTNARVTDPSGGYWGNSLLHELTQNPPYVTGLINARRLERGDQPLLDPLQSPIGNYGEYQVDGGWEYRFDLVEITPEEAAWLIEVLDATGSLPKDVQITYRPLRTRNFYLSVSTFDEPLVLRLGGKKVEVSPLSSVAAAYEAVEAGLKAAYGNRAVFDLNFGQNIRRDGYVSANINVSVELVD